MINLEILVRMQSIPLMTSHKSVWWKKCFFIPNFFYGNFFGIFLLNSISNSFIMVLLNFLMKNKIGWNQACFSKFWDFFCLSILTDFTSILIPLMSKKTFLQVFPNVTKNVRFFVVLQRLIATSVIARKQ